MRGKYDRNAAANCASRVSALQLIDSRPFTANHSVALVSALISFRVRALVRAHESVAGRAGPCSNALASFHVDRQRYYLLTRTQSWSGSTTPDTTLHRFERASRRVLTIAFWDLDKTTTRQGHDYEPITIFQAWEIVEFLDLWYEQSGGPEFLIAHCHADISRSAAVAKFAAERNQLDFDWKYPLANVEVLRKLTHAARAIDFLAEEGKG